VTGRLSQFVGAVAAKSLSAVEADTRRSNQHEFNGVQLLKKVLGDQRFSERPTRFIWFGENEEVVEADSWLTWYDAREKHPTRSEWRLYFPANAVTELARPGCLLVVAYTEKGLLCVLADEPTIQHQLLWLFGLGEQSLLTFTSKEFGDASDRDINYSEAWILEALGFEPEYGSADIDRILSNFPSGFPTTAEFSKFARQEVGENQLLDDPDGMLVAWLEHEEAMFRALEKHLISERLSSGFMKDGSVDVDGFISFSLSIQNRRKSRAGYSLENHLAAVFDAFGLRYVREGRTENQKKPDFLFPDAESYHDHDFPRESLVMLGVKSSCKDRWRQVLSEAARIERKHLLTLEPGISKNQTMEMQDSGLQLVLPASIHSSYEVAQQQWLNSVKEFIEVVQARQKA